MNKVKLVGAGVEKVGRLSDFGIALSQVVCLDIGKNKPKFPTSVMSRIMSFIAYIYEPYPLR